MGIIFALHVLAAVIWVGGMFFAYVVLRPVAVTLLEPPMRLTVWTQVFQRFFPWVWIAIVTLLVTGFALVFWGFGGMGGVGWKVHTMLSLGIVMTILFAYLYFKPFKQLQQAVTAEQWPIGGANLNRIRQIIAVNLSLGLLIVSIATIGRYAAF